MAARGDAIQDMYCENLRRKQKFPTEEISVSSVGNFRFQRWKFRFSTLEILPTAALAKPTRAVSRKVRQVRKAIPKNGTSRTLRTWRESYSGILTTDTGSFANRHKILRQPAKKRVSIDKNTRGSATRDHESRRRRGTQTRPLRGLHEKESLWQNGCEFAKLKAHRARYGRSVAPEG